MVAYLFMESMSVELVRAKHQYMQNLKENVVEFWGSKVPYKHSYSLAIVVVQ